MSYSSGEMPSGSSGTKFGIVDYFNDVSYKLIGSGTRKRKRKGKRVLRTFVRY